MGFNMSNTMMLSGLRAVFKREVAGYFITPVAYVFSAVFLILLGANTIYLGDFFQRNRADLEPFFTWHPWLYVLLIPAITMRLWAEERRSGTAELLLTLPVPLWQLVLGKFLAAWCFTGFTLMLTFPMWLTVNYLGDPDNGVILAGYIGSLLMAGSYLAIGSCISATTRSQVVAFVVSVMVCLMFTITGYPMIINLFSFWLPQQVVDTLALFSFLTHFSTIAQGYLEWRSLVYFGSLMALWLFATIIILEQRRS
jgi:ABC-2 type transport system permease protein